jgi:uncharacterized membrane protein YdjX (TVP38/TMEM64 family)
MNDNNKAIQWIKPVFLVLVLVALIIISRQLNLGQRIGEIKDWIKDMGILGPLVFILIYAVATVALIPGSAMTIFAGSIFGSLMGIIIVSAASTLGASLSFMVSKYFAREAVSKWLNESDKFRKLDALTEKHGEIIVAITRLVPLFPFTLLNYGFGLTKVPFKTYVMWSWLCMLPGTVLYVVGADAVTKVITEGKIPWILIGIFVFFIIILTLLIRGARRVLQNEDEK